MSKIKRQGFGWAWEFQPLGHGDEWHLCNWSAPSKEILAFDDFKPSDEARMVRVELVPTSKRNRKRYGYS